MRRTCAIEILQTPIEQPRVLLDYHDALLKPRFPPLG